MTNLKLLTFVLISLGMAQCSTSTPTRQISNTNQNPPSPADYQSFILGTWEGRAYYNGQDNQLVMYVTFKDNHLTVDYSPAGGAKFTEPYRFKDERTIEASRYPEHLIIEKHSQDEIRFRPEGSKLREDVEVIYACKFARTMK